MTGAAVLFFGVLMFPCHRAWNAALAAFVLVVVHFPGDRLLAEVPAPVALRAVEGRTYIGPQMEEVEDPSGGLTFDQVRSRGFSPVGSRTIHHGFTNSTWWFRFRCNGSGVPDGRVYFLSLFNYRMYDVSIRILAQGSVIKELQSGMIGQREVEATDLVFRLPQAQESTVYLRVRGITPVRMAPSIVTEHALRNGQLTNDLVIGLTMGGQFALAIFNLVLFFSIRDRSYLSFALFQILSVVLILNSSGYTYEWFLSSHPMLDLRATAPLCFATAFAVIAFSADYLGAKDVYRRAVDLALSLAGLGIVAAVFLPVSHGIRYAAYAGVLACLFIFWLSVMRILSGYKPARFFFAAFLPLLAFVFSFIVSRFFPSMKTGPFPASVFALGVPVATVASSILFSIALSGRFQDLRESLRKSTEERTAMQAAAEESLRQEKGRINRELHDVIGSDLSALIFDLQRRHEDPVLTRRLAAMLSRLRDLVHLNSLGADFNLAREIQLFARTLEGDDLRIVCTTENLPLPVVAAFHLHRIFLEAITNSLRHGRPSQITIRLQSRRGNASLLVGDNGDGFLRSAQTGSGLCGMKERCSRIGASLRILSVRGRGTLVVVLVPGVFLPLDAKR